MIDVQTPMFRFLASNLIASFLVVSCLTQPLPRVALAPANQLDFSRTACGPTALLNAFRSGDAEWQTLAQSIEGSSDRERIATLTRVVEDLPAATPRSRKRGVNVTDLRAAANVLTRRAHLPSLEESILFLKPGESLSQLLRRGHTLMHQSLAKGLPPVISIRRYVLRRQTGGGTTWMPLDAHFVTLRTISAEPGEDAASFQLSYIDPWGATIREGEIRISPQPILAGERGNSPCLEAVFPKFTLGNAQVRPGERTVVILAAAICRE